MFNLAIGLPFALTNRQPKLATLWVSRRGLFGHLGPDHSVGDITSAFKTKMAMNM